MSTTIRKLDGLPIEEPVLDEEGKAKQKALADLILREYGESGTLTNNFLNENVEQYESEIQDHVIS